MIRLRVGYFSASPVLALAQGRGLFVQRGMEIEAEAVTSSPAQFSSLNVGAYDLVLTSPDNVAAYRSGTDNPLGVRMDVRVIRAVDGGLGLALLGARGVGTVDDLRGRVIAVDVPDSGFAFALYELLATHGLHRGDDYHVVAMGSTPRRAVALRAGQCQATLLSGGFAVGAQKSGLVPLGRISEVVRPYLATVLAATGQWLDSHPVVVQRFCDVWQQAVTAVLAPGDAIDPLLAEVFNVPVAEIAVMRRILHDPAEGLVPDGAVDLEALDNVLRLRDRYGPEMRFAPVDGMVDMR